MGEAPAELWIRRSDGGYYRTMLDPPEPSAVRYVRADLYEAAMALNERVERAYAALLASAQQEPLGELGADYPR